MILRGRGTPKKGREGEGLIIVPSLGPPNTLIQPCPGQKSTCSKATLLQKFKTIHISNESTNHSRVSI
jgi:hypothetical protein